MTGAIAQHAAGLGQAGRRRHGPTGPMRSRAKLIGQSEFDHQSRPTAAAAAGPLARLFAQQTAAASARRLARRHSRPAHDLRRAAALARRQNDPRPPGCFCGLVRSATTPSNRTRSTALTSMLIPSRTPQHATTRPQLNAMTASDHLESRTPGTPGRPCRPRPRGTARASPRPGCGRRRRSAPAGRGSGSRPGRPSRSGRGP